MLGTPVDGGERVLLERVKRETQLACVILELVTTVSDRLGCRVGQRKQLIAHASQLNPGACVHRHELGKGGRVCLTLQRAKLSLVEAAQPEKCVRHCATLIGHPKLIT